MVSVIMSVYRQEEYISECLDSLISSQAGIDKIIVIDDFSDDDSISVVEKYSRLNQSIMVVRNPANLGLAKSLNRGVSLCDSNYIARIDSDDICLPNRIALQLDYMSNHPDVDILGSNATLIDMNSEVIGQTDVPLSHDEIVSALEFRNPMIHPSIMMKRSVLEKLAGYDESLRKAQDLDLWHRAAKAGFRFANLPDCLIKYRVDLNKSSKTIIKGFFVSFGYALKNRSIKGVIFSCIDLGKYFLIKLGLYTPRSLRGKR